MRLLAARRPLHTDISFPHLSFSSSPSAKIGKESEPPRKRKSSTPPTPADRAGGSRLGGGEKKSRRSRGAAEMSSHHQQQVRASHILIKHEGSRRKASWKDPDGVRIRSTTRESAVAQLKALREEITSGEARFEDVAARRSDCSSAKRGGDLDRGRC
ncbi:hypothetical protein Taro_033973 [Colocasia esculenta]|uniref:Peptidyl-prolyl cis-trans isomerase n=1 Tax=Colocasia esculenta TaxID=4460 RepID=A0A843W690_COLES|nr:hypothetical protein [Colocasia esculenta]